MTAPTMPADAAEIVRLAGSLSAAQRWFVSALSSSWTLPSEIGANPNHGSNRDRRLIEASTEGQGREYRLTPLGLALTAAALRARAAQHDHEVG